MTTTTAPISTRKRAEIGRAPQDSRGTWRTYLALAAVLFFSAFPLYWMFVVATSTDEAVSSIPPTVLPGSELMNNLTEVFTL